MKRIHKRLSLIMFAVLALCPMIRAQVRELGTGAPGGSGHAALSLTLEPGWHVYWVYAGDSGEPPQVMWSLPEGITLGPMQYPAPSRLPLGPLMDYGYEGRAM